MLAAPISVLSLPATFGRYVEYFRQRGQLRCYLRRVALAAAILVCISSTVLWLIPQQFSQLVFGTPDRISDIHALALALMATVAYNVVVELFISLRMQRYASGLEFLNSMLFAGLGGGLLMVWQRTRWPSSRPLAVPASCPCSWAECSWRAAGIRSRIAACVPRWAAFGPS